MAQKDLQIKKLKFTMYQAINNNGYIIYLLNHQLMWIYSYCIYRPLVGRLNTVFGEIRDDYLTVWLLLRQLKNC